MSRTLRSTCRSTSRASQASSRRRRDQRYGRRRQLPPRSTSWTSRSESRTYSFVAVDVSGVASDGLVRRHHLGRRGRRLGRRGRRVGRRLERRGRRRVGRSRTSWSTSRRRDRRLCVAIDVKVAVDNPLSARCLGRRGRRRGRTASSRLTSRTSQVTSLTSRSTSRRRGRRRVGRTPTAVCIPQCQSASRCRG